MIACPNAIPPSFGGTIAWVNGVDCLGRDCFHFHRGLRLVRHFPPNADQRRNGIKQPAHAAGSSTVDVLVELLLENTSLVGRAECYARQSFVPWVLMLAQQRKSCPIRPLDTRIASWQFEIFELSRAVKSITVGNQELAAPDRSVGSISCPIKTASDDGPIVAPTLLGNQRSRMSKMVLHADERRVDPLRQLPRPLTG